MAIHFDLSSDSHVNILFPRSRLQSKASMKGQLTLSNAFLVSVERSISWVERVWEMCVRSITLVTLSQASLVGMKPT